MPQRRHEEVTVRRDAGEMQPLESEREPRRRFGT
jgi:hypothetical protein